MKRFTRLRIFLLTLLCTLAFASCTDSDVPADDNPSSNSAAGKYISISVSTEGAAATRATVNEGTDTPPNGGEDGDGTENGNVNEYQVNKVSILLYQVPDDVDEAKLPSEGLINVAEETAEKIPVYVFCWSTYQKASSASGSSETDNVYTTGSRPLSSDIKLGKYRIVVVANADLSGLNGRSLAYIRNYVLTSEPFDRGASEYGTTNYNPTTYSDFVMSSYKEQNIIIGNTEGHCGTGSQSDPYVTTDGTIELERLAARVDFAPTSSTDVMGKGDFCTWNATDNTYDYKVLNDAGLQVATFKLKYVAPFNFTRQQYLFKHTTTLADLTTCNYMGRETDETTTSGSWNKHYATNYVLDPFTLKKGNVSSDLTAFYIPELYHHALTDNNNQLVMRYHVKAPTDMAYDSKYDRNYYIVGYSAENTLTAATQQTVDPAVSSYVAGLRFFGKYVKTGQTVDDAEWKAYDYYIRHSAPDGKADLTKPMTFGLVRNNIYRVFINSISAAEGDLTIHLKMMCIPWQRYEHEEIVM